MTRRLLLALVLALVAASVWSAAFDGYDTDTWTYRLIVERIAHGSSLLADDPFLLRPPPAPHVTPYWYAVGLLARLAPLPGDVWMRVLAFASIAIGTLGAWRLAGELLGEAWQAFAVALFWLAGVGTWPEMMLGRNLGWGFAMLALDAILQARSAARPPWAAVLWVGLAFSAHPFAGIIACGGVALGLWSVRDEISWTVSDVALRLLVASIMVAPATYMAILSAGPTPSSAHLLRPGVWSVEGWRALAPAEALRLFPPPLLLLTLVGLVVRVEPRLRAAQRLVRAGGLLAALVLFTPLYQWVTSLVGGWMVERLAALAFPWIAATLALASLAPRGGAGAFVASVLVLGTTANAGLVFAESFLDRPFRLAPFAENLIRPMPRAERRDRRLRLFYRFAPAAQQEAATLRERLAGRTYVSEPLLAYGLAATTLGKPLAVPPGHAAPTAEFARRARRVDTVLENGSPECWAELFEDFPDLEFLVTPAPEAEVESLIWSGRKGKTGAAVTRGRLEEAHALRNVFQGRYFVVDEIRRPEAAGPLGCSGGAR